MQQFGQWFRRVSIHLVSLLAVFALALPSAQAQRWANDDPAYTMQWITHGAGLGQAWAQTMLGVMYQTGQGVDADPKLAAEWFTKAANQGEVDAMFHLGSLYLEGTGVAQNSQQAVHWLSQASEQGHDEAPALLGDMYAFGRGVGAGCATGGHPVETGGQAGRPGCHVQPGAGLPARHRHCRGCP